MQNNLEAGINEHANAHCTVYSRDLCQQEFAVSRALWGGAGHRMKPWRRAHIAVMIYEISRNCA